MVSRLLPGLVIGILGFGLVHTAPPEDDPFAPSNAVDPVKPAGKGLDDPFDPVNRIESDPTKPPVPVKDKSPVDGGKVVAKLVGARPRNADRIDLSVSFQPAAARPGEVIKVIIEAAPKPGFWTYPITQRTENQDIAGLSVLTWQQTSGLQPLTPISETPPPEFADDPAFGIILKYKKPFTWTQDLLVPVDASTGPKTLRFGLRVQVCNTGSCTWGDHVYEANVNVVDGPKAIIPTSVQERLTARSEIREIPIPGSVGTAKSPPKADKTPAPSRETAPIAPIADTAEEHKAGLDAVLKELQATSGPPPVPTGLLAFMLTGVFWGAVSLVTPCVFPMIPITVSFFLKQSEKEHHRPVTTALVYCGTIIIVLTIAAVALLSFFRWLSVNPIMNFGLGALFIFFALSLFGMYDIELPASLRQYTESRVGKGGMVGTIFMALTFTIISFACVAPFLGGFGGTASDSGLTFSHRVLGGAAFAATFAAPFFVLALFPNLLKKMPRSGSWLNAVKVVMGFLELAAAFKFLRAGELVLLPKPVVFTYDLVMGLWIGICLLCGLYLLGFYRLPHDDEDVETISVPRLMWSFAFIGLGFYLLPAAFKSGPEGEPQRPNGAVYAWIDSFLLPELSESKSELPWSGNLKQVIDTARAGSRRTGSRQLVFVDHTGKTCTNCKLNERDVFPRPEIRSLLQRYHLVALYTDTVPDKLYSDKLRAQFGSSTVRQRSDAKANLDFQKKAFNEETLPLYAILEPLANGTIKVHAVYSKGLINDIGEFAEFLKKPLES